MAMCSEIIRYKTVYKYFANIFHGIYQKCTFHIHKTQNLQLEEHHDIKNRCSRDMSYSLACQLHDHLSRFILFSKNM